MQPFRQQPRLLAGRKRMSFPADAVITLDLLPLEPFGAANSGGSEVFGADEHALVDCRLQWDGDHGRITATSVPDPEPIDHCGPESLAYEVRGASVSFRFRAYDQKQLLAELARLTEVFPALLTVRLRSAISVHRVHGKVGQVPFRWVYEQYGSAIMTTSAARQVRQLESAVDSIRSVDWDHRPTLAAALHYFRVACRLHEVSPQAWEFLPETLLNLNKVLEVLFGPERDVVRERLRDIGLSEETIEGHFVPVMLMRNEFDVGHALMIGRLNAGSVLEISTFLSVALASFRELLAMLLDDAQTGVTKYYERSPRSDKQKQKLLNRILASVRLANAASDEAHRTSASS